MHASSYFLKLLFIKVNFTHETLFMEISKSMIWKQVYSMNRDEHNRI